MIFGKYISLMNNQSPVNFGVDKIIIIEPKKWFISKFKIHE